MALSFFSRARLATSLPTTLSPIYSRAFTRTAINMGITKKLISPGNGQDKPKKGDNITMEYTGNLYDQNAADGKGKQFDSSVGRGDFNTKIGVGQLIRGANSPVQSTELNGILTLCRLGRGHHRDRWWHDPRREGYSHHHWVSFRVAHLHQIHDSANDCTATMPTVTAASLASSPLTLPSSCTSPVRHLVFLRNIPLTHMTAMSSSRPSTARRLKLVEYSRIYLDGHGNHEK